LIGIQLEPGRTIRRTKLHEDYGGRRQGGISPSRQSANVFLITAPEGERYGYIYDGQGEDGFFYYTGEGQQGDQRMTQGHRAIRDDEEEGRELHVFEANGTELQYKGRFRYVADTAEDAPDTRKDEPWRKVIVFKLEQITGSRDELPRRRLDPSDRSR